MRSFKTVIAASVLSGVMLAGLSTATSASTYDFTQSGSVNTPALAAPGYGTAVVTTVGSDLEFQITFSPGWLIDSGNSSNHNPIEFRLTTSGLTISGTPSVASPLASPFIQASGSSFTNPSFNSAMNYAIACPSNGADGCNDVSSLTFYVLAAGALSLQLTDGVYITADIYNPNSPNSDKTGTVGAVLDTTTTTFQTTTPLPGALPLFAGGLGTMGLLLRGRKRKAAAAI